MDAEASSPDRWIEVIKILPGLLTSGLLIGVLIAYRKEVRRLLGRMTKFSGLGIEAEFSDKDLDDAIAAQAVAVSDNDKKGALRRLSTVAPLLRDARILWVDDNPSSTRHERALLERVGVRFTTVKTSADAERELRENVYLLVITDLKREGRATEGIDFVGRIATTGCCRWAIGYTGTNQWGKSVPPYFFGVTNRPDYLLHLTCDVAERERL